MAARGRRRRSSVRLFFSSLIKFSKYLESHNVGFFNAELWRLRTGELPDASVSGEEPGPGPFKSSGTRSTNTVLGFVADLTGRRAASQNRGKLMRANRCQRLRGRRAAQRHAGIKWMRGGPLSFPVSHWLINNGPQSQLKPCVLCVHVQAHSQACH